VCVISQRDLQVLRQPPICSGDVQLNFRRQYVHSWSAHSYAACPYDFAYLDAAVYQKLPLRTAVVEEVF
jgi:hypothetical protein